MSMDEPQEQRVRRILATVYPTPLERRLGRLASWCWERNDQSGPLNWLGDRADDLRVASQRWRADRG